MKIILQKISDLLTQLARLLGFPPDAPKAAPVAPNAPQSPSAPIPAVPPHVSKIPAWALGIQHAEGGKPTHPNMINNNPGNLKVTSLTKSFAGFEKETPAQNGGSFCIYKDYPSGFNALCEFLNLAATGQLPAYKDASLSAFTVTYTGDPAGSLKHIEYMAVVCAYTKVAPDTKINQLL